MSEVLYEKFEGYAIFTLNRPERLNAFNVPLREQFTAALRDFEQDPEMRVGIVTGAGRAFGSGADLKDAIPGLHEESADSKAAHAGQFSRSSRVFIAAVNGPCIAGAFEWTIDMDIRICSPEAYFGLFEVKRGLLPGFALQRLPQMIPFGEAMYLAVTGDTMSAERALRCGLVQEIVERDALLDRAQEIARMIVANAPRSVEGSRAMLRAAVQGNQGEVERLGAWVGRAVRDRSTIEEGAAAFAERRAANFER